MKIYTPTSLSLDRSTNAAASSDYVTNCTFDSDPDAMKSPYAASGTNRTYTYAHLRVAGNLAVLSATQLPIIRNNAFDHALLHVLLDATKGGSVNNPQLAPYLMLDQCTFTNFYLAGIAHTDAIDAQPSFNRPLTLTNCTFKFFKELAAPNTPQIAAARSTVMFAYLRPGVAGISSVFVPVNVSSSTFVQSDTSPYADFHYANYRTEQSGIDARWLRDIKPLTNASAPNTFQGLHYGIRYQLPANDMEAEIKGNLFAECEKGVDFVTELNSPPPANVSTAGTAWLDCNTFTRGVSPAVRQSKAYGIFVENGAAVRIDNPNPLVNPNTTFLRNLFDVNGLTTADIVAIENDYAALSLTYYTYTDYQPTYSQFTLGTVNLPVANPAVNSNPYQECAPSYNGVGIPRPAGAAGTGVVTAGLAQNTPNPATGHTTITYQVPVTTRQAALLIRRATDGVLIGQLSLDVKADRQEVDLHSYPTGVYFYTLLTDGIPVSTRRLIVR
ncbi:T9SS type A sorting domain-containing protein [Hymenobacter rubidus]|uniref:T9SS type A sorting domain-containing protein n=1 Tax=Hymenobacter rubidus TaxID=1441626 RepID=UPI00191D3516|nr:T9SS type A sorting domain-containing protein [Hymenobacter rubidus]